MGVDITGGYDVMFEISESEINTQIAKSHMEGGEFINFPTETSGELNIQGFSVFYNLLFDAPFVSVSTERPKVNLIVPFSRSRIEVRTNPNFELAPIAGEINLITEVSTEESVIGNDRFIRVVVDFNSSNTTVSDFKITEPENYTALLDLLNLDQRDFDEMVKANLLNFLRNDVGTLYLGEEQEINDIVLEDDGDGNDDNNYELDDVINELKVSTLPSTDSSKESSFIVGVNYRNNSSNLNTIEQSFLEEEDQSLLIISNSFTYFTTKLNLAQRFNIPISEIPSYFDESCNLIRVIRNQNINGYIVDVKSLQITIEEDRIRAQGSLFTKQGPANVNIDFLFYIMLSIEEDVNAENEDDRFKLVTTNTEPMINVDVDFEWWVWLSTIGLGAIVGLIKGAIVAPIVLAILEEVADYGVWSAISNELDAENLFEADGFPLGPLSEFTVPRRVVVDDIIYKNVVKHKTTLSVHNQKLIFKNGNWSLDLDQGKFYQAYAENNSIDLVYKKGSGLSSINNSRFGFFSKRFEDIDPYDIYSLHKDNNFISFYSFPYGDSFNSNVQTIKLGLITSDGRLCKLRIVRDGSFDLIMEWVVYNNPIPSLSAKANWIPITLSDKIKHSIKQVSGGRDGFTSCVEREASFKCEVDIWPSLISFPIKTTWIINGDVIRNKEGTISINNTSFKYEYSAKKFTLFTTMGQKVELEIIVEVSNENNQKLVKKIFLSQDGIHKNCNNIIKKFIPKPDYFVKNIDPEIYFYNPVSSLSNTFIKKVNELLK